MDCFEFVMPALKVMRARAEGTHRDSLDTMMQARFNSLDRDYDRLADHEIIEYDDVTRLIYMYKYVPAHASFMAQLLARLSALGCLSLPSSLRVACLGGGPGSELIGLANHIDAAGRKAVVDAVVLDRNRDWETSWRLLARELPPRVSVAAEYRYFELGESQSWHYFGSPNGVDLIILSYFLSEAWGVRWHAEEYLKGLFIEAASGTQFLLMDNAHRRYTDWFDDLAMAFGIELHETQSQDCLRLSVQPGERETAMGAYQVGYRWPHNPKLHAKLAVRVGYKP